MAEPRQTPTTETPARSSVASKVPLVTASFWVLKILTTGMGEAASDALLRAFGGVTVAVTSISLDRIRTDHHRESDVTAQTQTHTPTFTPEPMRLRASDAEREDTVARLHRALGEGRLDLAEIDERSTAAYAAQCRDELPQLLVDLPDSHAGHTGNDAPAWSELWNSAVWCARIAVLGASDRPTATQRRTAALLVGLAVLWTIACAFLGAGLVG